MHVKALSDGIVQAQPYASIERLVPGESSVGMYDPCKADTKKKIHLPSIDEQVETTDPCNKLV